MMPSNYFSERTLEEAIDVFVQTFAALDPAQPTTRQLSERWQRLLWRLDHQTAIDHANGFRARVGLLAPWSQRIEQMRVDLAAREAERRELQPPHNGNGKANAPAEWYSAEAMADQLSA